MKAEADTRSDDEIPAELESFEDFVIRRLGEDALRQIEEVYGGRQFYVAATAREHTALAKIVGLEAATVIGSEFGGLRVVLSFRMRSASRRRDIEQACIVGGTRSQIAKKFGITERWVGYIYARLRRQGRIT